MKKTILIIIVFLLFISLFVIADENVFGTLNVSNDLIAVNVNGTFINGNSTYQHQTYPAGCSSSFGVSKLGDSSTCTHFMLGTGDSVIGNYTFQGDVNITGRNLGPNYIELQINRTTIISLASIGVFANITDNVTNGIANGVTELNGLVTIGKTAIYHMIQTLSFKGGNDDNYHMTTFVNNVAISKCESHREQTSAAITGSMVGQCFLSLTAGDTLIGAIKNDDATAAAVTGHYSWTIREIG